MPNSWFFRETNGFLRVSLRYFRKDPSDDNDVPNDVSEFSDYTVLQHTTTLNIYEYLQWKWWIRRLQVTSPFVGLNCGPRCWTSPIPTSNPFGCWLQLNPKVGLRIWYIPIFSMMSNLYCCWLNLHLWRLHRTHASCMLAPSDMWLYVCVCM